MRSNVKLGKISGIEIGLHYSWFIIATLIVFSLVERFREAHASWTRSEIWAVALVTAALFFISLLLHELAHSWVAQKHGLRVKAITLSRSVEFLKSRTIPKTRRQNSGLLSPDRLPA